MDKVYSRIVFLLTLAVGIAFIFYGCSGGERDVAGLRVKDITRSVADMASDEVIVRINGKEIRKSDFTALQNLQRKLFLLFNGSTAGVTLEDAERFLKANEQRVIPQLMRNEILRQAADRLGIVATAEEKNAYATKYLGALGLASTDITLTKKKIGGPEAELLEQTFFDSARDVKVVEKLANPLWFKVSPQEVTNQYEYVKNFNENARKMNELAKKTLLEAKEEIINGGNFAEVTKRIAEVNPEYGKEWQTVEIGELVAEGEQELKTWLQTAKVGDISDPIDLDDGIAIIGLVMKGEGTALEGMEPPMLYTLVRCTLFARQEMEDMSPEGAEEFVRNFKRGEAAKEVGAKLFAETLIEYPNGTNFFDNVCHQSCP